MSSTGGPVIIVGASSGIGAALALEYARAGRRVAVLARRADRLAEVVSGCNEVAGKPVAIARSHDVIDTAAVPALFAELLRELGGLETFIYAAGSMAKVGVDEFDFGKDDGVLATNLVGAVAWLDQAATHFQARGMGRVAAISSIAGDRGRRAYPSYHAAKAGLSTFLESLRNRLSRHGVSVTTIKPGFIDTDMTRGMKGLFWLISPEAAARTIMRHVEKGAGVRYVPCRWLLVSLIIRSIPSFIFRRLDI